MSNLRILADDTSMMTQDSIIASIFGSFLAVFTSEIGDKTFFLVMMFSMKHSKWVIFSSAFGALTVMTILSVLFGKILPLLMSKITTDIIVTCLFFYFGITTIYVACKKKKGQNSQLKEVQRQFQQQPKYLSGETADEKSGKTSSITKLKKIQGQLKQSQQVEFQKNKTTSQQGLKQSQQTTFQKNKTTSQQSLNNEISNPENDCQINRLEVPTMRQVFIKIFSLIFLAEWGDRSQITTMAMAATMNPLMVIVGASFGHLFSVAISLKIGQYVGSKINQKHIQYVAGCVFLISGIGTFVSIF